MGRRSGILLHVTSLPCRFGIGDLGPESRNFVDYLGEAGQKLWCVLPLGPTGPMNSPYQCRSAFAGNPLLLSPEFLVEQGYISKRELNRTPKFPESHVNFPAVRKYKDQLLQKAFRGFSADPKYAKFEQSNRKWLEPYALFTSLQQANGGVSWTKFDPNIEPSEECVRFHKFVQYEFARQWKALHEYCRKRNVSIMGDMPFYVEHDSVDVWANREFFDLRRDGEPRTVGGVPPDYFSRDGQLWGNPTYCWDNLKKDGFQWWIDRFSVIFDRVDLLRLDHFRGFEAYWRVQADSPTARKGRWIKTPGVQLFETVRKKLGSLPFVAENLGIITPEVEKLRGRFEFPGMAVLQFGFDEAGTHRPNNYVRDLISFTGTHDNDTTNGWWRMLQRAARKRGHAADRATVERLKAYLQQGGSQIHWPFIQAVETSVADVAIIPMQDVLGLGSEGRMNLPGRAKGNWDWRLQKDQMRSEDARRLRALALVSGRA
jgi:4-alpha-glucanotransferase